MKENSAKSIAVGIAVKIVLLAVLVLVLDFYRQTGLHIRISDICTGSDE